MHSGAKSFDFFTVSRVRSTSVTNKATAKSLTARIENKLVTKKENDGHTLYVLSEKGKNLIPILEQVTNWHSNKSCRMA